MEQKTHKVPIDAVGADELPRETAVQYEDMCRMIGHLYVRLNLQEKIQNEQMQSMVGHLQSRIQEYINENRKLKMELSRYENGREEPIINQGDGREG